MNPNQVYYSSNSSGPSRGKRLLVFFGLLLVGVGAIALFLILGNSSGNKQNNSSNKTSQNKDSGTVLNITVVRNPSLSAPKDMKAYVKDSSFVNNVGDYTTKDAACNLQFGIVTANELPGATQEEVAITHLGASANFGAVGGDPVKTSDLILKATNGNQRYSLPTYKFEFSRDDVNYLASYSIALLADGGRAYVRTYCSNTGEAVSAAAFKKINAKAKEITVNDD